MSLGVRNKKTKNHWSISTLKCSNNVHVRSLLETKIITVGSTNDFRGFESSTKLNGWWLFKGDYINKFTGECSNGSKTVA